MSETIKLLPKREKYIEWPEKYQYRGCNDLDKQYVVIGAIY